MSNTTDDDRAETLPAGTRPDERVHKALAIAFQSGGNEEAHHKAWVIDQMVRALTGCPLVDASGCDVNNIYYTYQRQGESDEYKEWVRRRKEGDFGPDTYDWDEGIAP